MERPLMASTKTVVLGERALFSWSAREEQLNPCYPKDSSRKVMNVRYYSILYGLSYVTQLGRNLDCGISESLEVVSVASSCVLSI